MDKITPHRRDSLGNTFRRTNEEGEKGLKTNYKTHRQLLPPGGRARVKIKKEEEGHRKGVAGGKLKLSSTVTLESTLQQREGGGPGRTNRRTPAQ